VFWLAGAGALVALGTMLVMNNNGGAIVSGTLTLAGNPPAQGASIPGAMAGGNGQSGSRAGTISGGNQSGNGFSNSAAFISAANGFAAVSTIQTGSLRGNCHDIHLSSVGVQWSLFTT
jgi:hypothetical protein